MLVVKKSIPLGSVLLFCTLLLVGCVPTRAPEPLRYTPATDLEIPAPAKASNYIYGIVDCRDTVGLLRANTDDAEDLLNRNLQDMNFSDVNCYTLSSSEMDRFYDKMTEVIENADYEMADEMSIYPLGTEIIIEFWESRDKNKVLIYSGSGDFIVMNSIE